MLIRSHLAAGMPSNPDGGDVLGTRGVAFPNCGPDGECEHVIADDRGGRVRVFDALPAAVRPGVHPNIAHSVWSRRT